MVELLVTELVTNAVQYAYGDIEVTVCVVDALTRVEVSDMSPAAPSVREPDAGGGRGLHLVGLLADRWGVDRRGQGKTVWFEVSPNPTW